MALGKMRHRVELQSRTRATDGAGGVSSSWETIAEVWAHIEPKSGSEGFKGDQIESRQTYNMKIRYRSGLETGMRVKFGDRLFNIVSSINDMERSKYINLTMVEGVAV